MSARSCCRIFIASTEAACGKTSVAVGLACALGRAVERVGYFKPVGQRFASSRTVDEDVLTVRELLGLEDDPADMCPITLAEIKRDLLEGRREQAFGAIRQALEKVCAGKDAVIIEGTDSAGMVAQFEFDVNVDIAKALEARVVLVASGRAGHLEELVANIEICKGSYDQKACQIAGVIVNGLPEADYQEASRALRGRLERRGVPVLGIIPREPRLGSPRMRDIQEALGAKVVAGENYLSNVALDTRVVAMQVQHMLPYLREGTVAITPGDRGDVVLAAACMQVSSSHPRLAGVVLTGGMPPAPEVLALVADMGGFTMPVLLTESDTFSTALKVQSLDVRLRPGDHEKLDEFCALVDAHVDKARLLGPGRAARARAASPGVFLERLVEQARAAEATIVFPEGDEDRTLQAVAQLLRRKICRAVLLDRGGLVARNARRLGVDVSRAEIIDVAAADVTDYARRLYELRQAKGMTESAAADQIRERAYYGTMLVQAGAADGLVSGAVHSTASTIRPALQIIRTAPGVEVVSSVFFMLREDKVFLYGDCAIVEQPTAEQLADIAVSSAGTARAFGVEPYVAMLSYSTGHSGRGPSVDKVERAVALVRKRCPELVVEGPLQYDAAFDPEVARIKMPESRVAGRATVYIFPDLNSGNIAYKAVQREAGATALGPVLQGLAKPVNDLSRGCSVEDIVYLAAITAGQARPRQAAAT
jgi:phosphate acetyltransferase